MLLDLIRKAEDAARDLPQCEFQTNHHFANGMYAREIFMAAGTFAIGKMHKQEHFFMITKGKIQIATEEGSEIFEAPGFVVARPGTKRALFVLEDAICISVHKTDKTDLDEIEKEVMEDDPLALFDARNQLKNPALNAQKELSCLG